MRVLSAADLGALVPMADAIAAVRQAFVELSAGRVIAPLRARVPVDAEEAVWLAMPGYAPRLEALGAKLVAVFPRNAAAGRPTVHAVVVMADPATGAPTGLLEGASLTALRTGAAGGLAADLLARSDAGIVALFGAGTQARAQLEAVCTVRAVTQVRIVARRRETAEATAAWARRQPWIRDATVLAAADASVATRGADIVITATTSPVPVFPSADVAPGAHITAVGAFTPTAREVPGEVIARARVIVDSREAALAEAGDILEAVREGRVGPEVIRAELGEVASGRAPGRTSAEEITCYKSVGHAALDLAVARLALARAEAAGVGTAVAI